VAVFAKFLALEVMDFGIHVNAIMPGRVLTDRVRCSHETRRGHRDESPDATIQAQLKRKNSAF
jgi:NAD(P)-dependent dehydrogenase (short-subunit alcohol dehydrogenase family)